MLLMMKINIGMMGVIQTIQGMKTMKTKGFSKVNRKPNKLWQK
jgi:hypothetical protein